MNCVDVLPEGSEPHARAIGKIKEMMVLRTVGPRPKVLHPQPRARSRDGRRLPAARQSAPA